MGLKESLQELQKKERLSVKREVKKELTKIKKDKIREKKCGHCAVETARYFLKGSSVGYCRNCAKELFGELSYLQK
jgi:hypothetical protein